MYLILFMCYTGFRETAFRTIRKEHVDLDKMTVTGGVKTKAGYMREIPLHPNIQPIVLQMMQRPGEYLLTNEYGKQMSDAELRMRHQMVIAPYMDRHYVPHECRHTFRNRLDNMSVVLLYIGLYTQEICVLTSDDMDSRYIHLPNERTNLYGRDIPLHPVIVQPLKHVLRFLETQDSAHVNELRRQYGVRRMVGEATERYCGRKHTPKQCRSSFASRIEEAGASGGMITTLLGTKLSYWNGFSVAQRAYSHPSRDNIYEAVMNVR